MNNGNEGETARDKASRAHGKEKKMEMDSFLPETCFGGCNGSRPKAASSRTPAVKKKTGLSPSATSRAQWPFFRHPSLAQPRKLFLHDSPPLEYQEIRHRLR
jgi:hypothetical protein